MKVLITGGCGFIGSNVAYRFLENANEIVLYDNLSRAGSEKNLLWLKERFKKKLTFIEADVTDHKLLEASAKGCDNIFHTAAQVAVTTSLSDPRRDFEVNALGTFNVLDAARKNDCGVVYCSTNKVYGNNINAIPLKETATRYEFNEEFVNGIREKFPVDAREHTPYGTSKLVGEHYLLDFSAVYGINTISNRMSCIYGVRQFGTADQGWLMHFIRTVLSDRGITLYGDGKQVRDALFISDLVNLVEKEMMSIKNNYGEIYNIGGGKENTLSLLELISLLEGMLNKKIQYSYDKWRPFDQKVYYSDITKAEKELGWKPEVSLDQGIKTTIDWAQKEGI